MYSFEPLTLAHQSFVEKCLQTRKLGLAEYSFANLFLFRDVHNHEISTEGGGWVRGVTYDGTKYLIPLSPISTEMSSLLDSGAIFYPIPDEEIKPWREGNYSIRENVADRDYLYKIDTFARYPGRKLAGRRNLVKQFREKYSYRVEEFSKENLEEVKELLHDWGPAEKKNDIEECSQALELFDRLKLRGQVTLVDEKVVGFLLGSPLNQETFLYQFSKALHQFKGLTQFMYQHLASSLKDLGFTWINLEQDLGVKGLQQAKRAYQPDKMGIKWRVSR